MPPASPRTTRAYSQVLKERTAKQKYDDMLEAKAQARQQAAKLKRKTRGASRKVARKKQRKPPEDGNSIRNSARSSARSSARGGARSGARRQEKSLFVTGETDEEKQLDGGYISSTLDTDEDKALLNLSVGTASQQRREHKEDNRHTETRRLHAERLDEEGEYIEEEDNIADNIAAGGVECTSL